MMHEEFEQLAGYRVTYEDYQNIIEPMYMATTLSKEEFIETLNRKRFEYIPQESPEVLALEAELADIKAAIKETQYLLKRYKTFYKEDGHFRLQPENSSMAPIIVPDCKIIGIVKGVFRYF